MRVLMRVLMRMRVFAVAVGMRMGVRVLQSGVLLFAVVMVLRVVVVLMVVMHVAFLAMVVTAAAALVLLNMAVNVRVVVTVPVPVLDVRGAAVDVELHALDVLPLRAVEVHVEVADGQLAQLPFERARLHTEVHERADGHVAADSGNAV
jgi:hypothetical protein